MWWEQWGKAIVAHGSTLAYYPAISSRRPICVGGDMSQSNPDPYGSGPALDEYYDLQINSAGGILTDTGRSFLEQDLAYMIDPVLQAYLGVLPGSDELVGLKADIRSTIGGDRRITRIPTIENRITPDGVESNIDIVGTESEISLTAEVSE